MADIPAQFDGATVKLKANVYFDGKVISHTVTTREGKRKTVGIIHQGIYKFDTQAAERMELIAGNCRVKPDSSKNWWNYRAGDRFDVPGNSSFEIAVDTGILEYLCSYDDSKK
jgi:purine/pyrimidine-nucleoside phosphorylase